MTFRLIKSDLIVIAFAPMRFAVIVVLATAIQVMSCYFMAIRFDEMAASPLTLPRGSFAAANCGEYRSCIVVRSWWYKKRIDLNGMDIIFVNARTPRELVLVQSSPPALEMDFIWKRDSCNLCESEKDAIQNGDLSARNEDIVGFPAPWLSRSATAIPTGPAWAFPTGMHQLKNGGAVPRPASSVSIGYANATHGIRFDNIILSDALISLTSTVVVIETIMVVKAMLMSTVRWRLGKCTFCGYERGGLASCPECGHSTNTRVVLIL